MESKPTLVWSDRIIELHTVPTVDLHFTCIVHPGHSELDNAIGLHHAMQNPKITVVRMTIQNRLERNNALFNGLKELGFARIPLGEAVHELLNEG